jgi:3-methyladenine DNA glycosylase AlkD
MRRQLKKLKNKQFAEDIKTYITSPHEFYGVKIPELKTMAKRLHEEYKLKKFYKLFDKFWKSSYHEEMSLAIYTLQLYQDEFNLGTWRFLKTKLEDVKSWDQIDSIGSQIIGIILLKYPRLEKEILRFAKGENPWLKRMAIVSTLPLIKQGDIRLAMKISEMYLEDKEEHIQKAVGWILRESAKQDKERVKKFILKHIHTLSNNTFHSATENMKELRKVRRLKKFKGNKPRRRLLFWKN